MTTTPPRLHPLPSPPKKLGRWKRIERWINRRAKPNGVLDYTLTGLLVLACIAGVIALIAAVVLLGGLIFYIAWNLGVVGVVEAAGGSVAKIGFWTAVGASLFLGIIGNVFRRGTATTAK